MTKPAGRRNHCVLLLIFLTTAVLIAVAGATVVWLDTQREYQARARAFQNELARRATLAEQLPFLQEQLKELDQKLRTTAYFLTGVSPAQAEAELAEQLKASLPNRNTGLLKVGFLARVPMQRVVRIGVRAHVRGNETALVRLLHRNEQAKPLTFVENLTVQKLRSSHHSFEAEAPRMLDIRFDLVSYLLRE